MSRLIIDFPDGMDLSSVCNFVRLATREGKISQSAGVPHYCWVSVFNKDGVVVYARRKKPGQKSDSLSVRYVEQEVIHE